MYSQKRAWEIRELDLFLEGIPEFYSGPCDKTLERRSLSEENKPVKLNGPSFTMIVDFASGKLNYEDCGMDKKLVE